MGIPSKNTQTNNKELLTVETTEKQYNISSFDYYRKGYLKGYAAGFITFNYDNREYDHEFLYRYEDDPDNGEGNQIISIDYGYKIPYIEEVWQAITEELKQQCINIERKARIDDSRVEQYAGKFLADNNRDIPITDEALQQTFAGCVIPAADYLYNRIKTRIEEMRNDSRYKFYDDEL